MVMVYVPEGAFTMGSNTLSDEKPVHTVYLDAYWIDQTEVTNAMYALCVQAGTCQPPDQTSSTMRNSYYDNFQYSDYPVIYVDWDQANCYCQWAEARLPTEAEWEKAARGLNEWLYPWGNRIAECSLSNYSGCVGDTTAVGKYPSGASPYGALDMAGNVWEWVADIYDSGYYAYSPSNNPQGATSGYFRILRGGSWINYAGIFIRTANRGWYDSSRANDTIGFRCARSAASP